MIEDASTELLLLEEEKAIPMKIGNAFIDIPSEQVEGYLSEKREKVKGELDNLSSSMNGVRQQMNQLKILLYAKFKSSINLETDWKGYGEEKERGDDDVDIGPPDWKRNRMAFIVFHYHGVDVNLSNNIQQGSSEKWFISKLDR